MTYNIDYTYCILSYITTCISIIELIIYISHFVFYWVIDLFLLIFIFTYPL